MESLHLSFLNAEQATGLAGGHDQIEPHGKDRKLPNIAKH